MELSLVNGRLLVPMKKFYGIFNREDMKRFFGVHHVDDRRERGRLSRTRGPGNQDDPISQLHDVFQLCRQVQFIKAGNPIGNYAHYDRTASTLAENVHAESACACHAVGQIRGAILFELANGMFVLAHQVLSNLAGIQGSQAFKPFEPQLNQLAADLNLRGAAWGKNQVADVAVRLEHRGYELRRVKFSLRWRRLRPRILRWYCLCRSSHCLFTRSPEGGVAQFFEYDNHCM